MNQPNPNQTKSNEPQKPQKAAIKVQISLQRVVVMVVGAGRGPLVQASVDAIKLSGIDKYLRLSIKIYALEKNPSSVVTMKAKKKLNWTTQSQVFC